ncbi:PREDICTED: mitochondrial folate transporter/carrier-like [Amphimedon queenslandica]|uniref:Solute carrier family 25 member 32 n=1 Tax=Amphimedon queenslandica TaxID=400682 RepID=A0A1X7ULL4_AMPQE|nr:PREDICTED: mitochondrial folate transporter/carrier-like [Amphimedon queenslandica]|eukprot:XP_003387458.1 PREDICTED: mitochondrial folate transporter/carrier-like [Amphimedon queenslandica]
MERNSHFTSSSFRSLLSGIRYQHLVAGLCGGVASTLVTHPFDLIKLRFAVQDGAVTDQRPKYQGLTHAFRTIYRQDGILGLYRGSSANVVGAGLSWGFYFFFYNAFKFQAQDGNLKRQLSPLMHMLLASCAGVLTLSLTNPIWVIKTRLCLPDTESVPSHMRYKGLRDGLWKLYKYEGIRGLYKGYIPGLVGTSHGTIQFVVYEELKKTYCNYQSIPITAQLGPLTYIAMAATSKAVAASVTYPYQVIRARLQDQEQKYSGVISTIKRTWRNEGYKGFYKGLKPNLIKVVPATCITFVVYEYMSKLLLQQ